MRFCILNVMLMSVCGLSAMKLPKEAVLPRNDVAFFRAVEEGEVPLVKLLLDRGIEVTTLLHGMTPLEVALTKKRFGVARILLKEGAQVNLQDRSGDTPLHMVVRQMVNSAKSNPRDVCTDPKIGSYMEMVNLLACHGADYTVQNKQGNTVFHEICAGAPQSIKHLYCGVLRSIFSGQSVLNDYIVEGEVAVAEAQPEMQSMIAKVKKVLALKNARGKTLAHMAGDYAHDEACGCFDILPGQYLGDDATFIKAVKTGDVGLVKLFLERKVLEHITYANQAVIPLHIALDADHFIIAGMLLEAGTSCVNARDFQDDMPLHKLVRNMVCEFDRQLYFGRGLVEESIAKYREMLLLLLFNGADVGARNKPGKTVFHEICADWPQAKKMRQYFYCELLRLIFSAQTVLHEFYLDNKTDVHMYLADMKRIMNKLREATAAKDKYGRTILRLVCVNRECDHTSCAARTQLLLGVGQDGMHRFLRLIEGMDIDRFYEDEAAEIQGMQ